MIEGMLCCLLTNGHVLIEGVPGLAKTTAIAALARAINTGFRRIQFTPDLLPADLIGTMIYRPNTGEFTVKHGPIFSNLILADEINRAPAKVQSALLEAMQERQVTIGEQTFRLPDPFLVLATQNPIEQEGTYALPEAQVDRFAMKLVVRYPSAKEERVILDRMASTDPKTSIDAVMQPQDIAAARRLVDQIFMEDRIKDYIVDLVITTRDPNPVRLLATRHHCTHARGQGKGIPRWTRLCRAAGCEGCGAQHAEAPTGTFVRGGGVGAECG
jgi:MoxR-like ATPase